MLESILELAKAQFGYLAKTTLNSWGITRTEDFGEIVFTLVEHELMGSTEEDSKDDFKDGYNFTEAFEEKFDFNTLPTRTKNKTGKKQT